MENFIPFLITEQGQYLCWAFLFIGVVVTPVEVFVFTRISKKSEQQLTATTSVAEREVFEKKIKNIKKIILLVITYGGMFAAFAVWGLTRGNA